VWHDAFTRVIHIYMSITPTNVAPCWRCSAKWHLHNTYTQYIYTIHTHNTCTHIYSPCDECNAMLEMLCKMTYIQYVSTIHIHHTQDIYGVATISRLLQTIGLFCRI